MVPGGSHVGLNSSAPHPNAIDAVRAEKKWTQDPNYFTKAGVRVRDVRGPRGAEPAALNVIRQRAHDAWLPQNCATSPCHGGLDGGCGALFCRFVI